MCLLDHNPPLCGIKLPLCCQKLRKGDASAWANQDTGALGDFGAGGSWSSSGQGGRVRRLAKFKIDQELHWISLLYTATEIPTVLDPGELSNSTVKNYPQ